MTVNDLEGQLELYGWGELVLRIKPSIESENDMLQLFDQLRFFFSFIQTSSCKVPLISLQSLNISLNLISIDKPGRLIALCKHSSMSFVVDIKWVLQFAGAG